MKIILLILQIFLITNLYSDKNWIEIEKSNIKQDINLSKIEIIKQLVYSINKNKKIDKNKKKWFIIHSENIK